MRKVKVGALQRFSLQSILCLLLFIRIPLEMREYFMSRPARPRVGGTGGAGHGRSPTVSCIVRAGRAGHTGTIVQYLPWFYVFVVEFAPWGNFVLAKVHQNAIYIAC